MHVQSFADEWLALTRQFTSGSIDYNNRGEDFKTIAEAHFTNLGHLDRRGTYAVRQKSSGQVLYIGNGGTVDGTGVFKGQCLWQRLGNTRTGNTAGNAWWRSLLDAHGPLQIDYVLLEARPLSPALAEALLLQAHLNEKGSLPCRNRRL